VDIPLVGFGTYKVGAVPSSTTIKYTPSRGTCEVLEDAFSVGYRMLDCAEYYINEAGIGEAIAKSKIPRGDM
jgi:diketogulonate reductase-like aldo/keto reductase